MSMSRTKLAFYVCIGILAATMVVLGLWRKGMPTDAEARSQFKWHRDEFVQLRDMMVADCSMGVQLEPDGPKAIAEGGKWISLNNPSAADLQRIGWDAGR